MSDYDLLGLALFDIISAQAVCANNGIFLRGGISHGSFFYDDSKDILISPALARAYELESKYAKYPIIVVPESTKRKIFDIPKEQPYAEDSEPMPDYFKKHDQVWSSMNDESLFFLDYVGVMLEEEHYGWDNRDRIKYIEAGERGDFKQKQILINRKWMKNAAYFLKFHKREIEKAYASVEGIKDFEKIREKYQWLMKYHNESFQNDLPYLGKQVIDLSKFQPL